MIVTTSNDMWKVEQSLLDEASEIQAFFTSKMGEAEGDMAHRLTKGTEYYGLMKCFQILQ